MLIFTNSIEKYGQTQSSFGLMQKPECIENDAPFDAFVSAGANAVFL